MGLARVRIDADLYLGGTMTELVVIQAETRRSLCLSCDHVDIVVAKGEPIPQQPGIIAPEDYIVCERMGRMMTCEFASLLRSSHAKCPHPDVERAARWNHARLDSQGGCGGQVSNRPITPPPGGVFAPRPQPATSPLPLRGSSGSFRAK